MIMGFTLFYFLLLSSAASALNLDSFIPKGWQAGNGFRNDPYPYYLRINTGMGANKEIILHYSFVEKGEYLPDKHIISFLSWNGAKYIEKWKKTFNSIENIFFLVNDINKDGKKELIVHGLHSGNGAYGNLWVFQFGKTMAGKIFDKAVQGERYLWNDKKRQAGICPEYFPDLDKDGILEIMAGHRAEDDKVACVDEPWWIDIYKWNGGTYILANNKFPKFYKNELADYRSYVKEKGENESIKKFIKRAEKIING